MVSMAPTSVTNTNAGRSSQKRASNRTSNPGHAVVGVPIQAAAATRSVSYTPNSAATTQPTPIPIIGAHSRHAPVARNARAAIAPTVAAAQAGAAPAGAFAGRSSSISNTIGTMVTAINAITVPDTTGVMMRRSSESRAANKNWNSADATISVASSAGPPSVSAVTQTAMNAPDVPMMSTCPAPNRPTRTACRMVLIPLTTTAMKIAHDKYVSLCPAARITMAGVSTTPPRQSSAA